MMTVPPPREPPFVPRATAVPLLGRLPRLRPDSFDGDPAADVVAVVPPPEPELDVEPPDEGAGADEVAVPCEGVSAPRECCASAAAGTASTPIRIAGNSCRIIC